jgi:uncharacterized protein
VNRLANETSPYLRQHAENPVDWYPWGDEAFELARAQDRPVLLSIGYSACHWCHVMAHESFEDEEIAALMNELFVNVKVDREERPDVDALYMQATLALTGSGGWPMTVFLMPDGRPFYAGTYFPPSSRGGMPGFPDLCRAIMQAYRTRRDDLELSAQEVGRRLEALSSRRPSSELITARLLDEAEGALEEVFDPRQGGFAGAPKFPPTLALEFLLRRLWRRPDDERARRMAELTLLRMAEGGIHDQLGGGFHRYSVDEVWLVPHFEKMLYDNALLARDYTLASRTLGGERHRTVAEATLDYLLREMRGPDGGFCSAQDADSPGGEGAFFVWRPEELAAALEPDEAAAVTVRYGVRPGGNFEGATILRVAATMEEVERAVGPDAGRLLESARAKLLAVRAGRPAPARDDKVLTGWNGLTIAALADAGAAFDRPDYLDAARETAAFLLERMVVDGRLLRVWMNGRARHLGCLDDYADLAHGLLALYEATFEPRWLEAARELGGEMVRLFADPVNGGFYYAGSDAEALVARTRDLEDHPTPAGNSQAAWVLLRLAHLAVEPELERIALDALRLVRDDAARFPQAFGTALVALDFHTAGPREVAIAGRPDDPATTALVATSRLHAGPDAVMAVGDPADPRAAAAAPLLAQRPAVNGRPAAYVCERFVCAAPVTDAEALAAQLRR